MHLNLKLSQELQQGPETLKIIKNKCFKSSTMNEQQEVSAESNSSSTIKGSQQAQTHLMNYKSPFTRVMSLFTVSSSPSLPHNLSWLNEAISHPFPFCSCLYAACYHCLYLSFLLSFHFLSLYTSFVTTLSKHCPMKIQFAFRVDDTL